MIEFAAAFVLGLASSGHCAAMCGPLMVAWRQQAAGARGAGGIALYHLSRIAVYAVLGVVAGLAGQVFSGGGFARSLSIASGLVLIAMALGRVGGARDNGDRAAGNEAVTQEGHEGRSMCHCVFISG